jgi:tripartite-type tricarboxylate transporter receptor subunit TctC
LPDVPTTTEAGFVHSDYEFWVGALAPTGMPRALVDHLNQEIVKPIETLQVRERLESIGGSASPLSAQAFADQFKREVVIDAALVKAAGLEAN